MIKPNRHVTHLFRSLFTIEKRRFSQWLFLGSENHSVRQGLPSIAMPVKLWISSQHISYGHLQRNASEISTDVFCLRWRYSAFYIAPLCNLSAPSLRSHVHKLRPAPDVTTSEYCPLFITIGRHRLRSKNTLATLGDFQASEHKAKVTLACHTFQGQTGHNQPIMI